MEAFEIVVADSHGDPLLSKDSLQHLDAESVKHARKEVALQLSRAGVRLALVLNRPWAAAG